MDLEEKYVRELCRFAHRGATTENEKKASEYIKEELEKIGIETKTEKFKYEYSWQIVIGLHISLIIVASLLSFYSPLPSLILALVTIVSFWGDFTLRFQSLRKFVPRRCSQNVVGKIANPRAEKRIIITAHYDTFKTGLLFHPKVVKTLGSASEKISPLDLPYLGMLVLTILIFIKSLGIDIGALGLIQLIFTLLFLGGFLIILDSQIRGRCVPGANDNASGVASMLSIANQLKEDSPSNCELWFVALGSEELFLGGMIKFMKSHFAEFDKDRTYFLNLDTIGYGELGYLTQEGFLKPYTHSSYLSEIARKISGEGKIGRLKEFHLRMTTDALVPTSKGFKAISFLNLDKRNIVENYHWYTDLPDTLNYDLIKKTTSLVVEFVRCLNNSRE